MGRGGAAVIVVLAWLLAAAPAQAEPRIQAHRGGSVVLGVASFPENTMPAFRAAAAEGWTLELDVSRTADGMVVLHDPTLDRTTICSGPARARTTAQLAACPSDVLGSPGSVSGGRVDDTVRVALPQLEEVLAFARASGARVSVEIKNIPTEEDFDPTMRLAVRVVEALEASGVPPARVVVQSFWPPNLDVVEARAPQYRTSLLTLAPLNDAAPLFARARGYEWVSPQWPVRRETVELAHRLGLKVTPYTLDLPDEVRAAAAVGVDALITDDPAMARDVLARAARRGRAPRRRACQDARPWRQHGSTSSTTSASPSTGSSRSSASTRTSRRSSPRRSSACATGRTGSATGSARPVS